MISLWDFDDAEKLLPAAAAIAPRLAKLAARWRHRGWPVVYANDNRGRWKSDRRELISAAIAAGGPGARVTELLAPCDDDYFVLKPMHSAFYATPLEPLLTDIGATTIAIAGVTSDQCVLATVIDARMRGREVMVVADAVASLTPARNRAALHHFRQVLEIETPRAVQLPWPPRSGARRSSRR